MYADLFKQLLDEGNEVVCVSFRPCCSQYVGGECTEFFEERVRRKLETVVNDDRNRAHSMTLRLEELTDEAWPLEATVGTHHQEHGDTPRQVLMGSQYVACSRQGEEPLQQFSDQQGRAHRLLIGVVHD